jgi:hypothetical protein
VKDAGHAGGSLTISFDDGSQAHIKTGAPLASPGELKGREVKGVRQAGDKMSLDFTDGSSTQIRLTGPTSSVMVRDRDDNLEYAD